MTSQLAPGVLEAIMASAQVEIEGPKRGEEIFEGTNYPHTFEGFVGQSEAIEELVIAIFAAKAEHRRLDHTLIKSGIAGVGKTTIATIVAYLMEVGLIRTSGPLTLEKFHGMLNTCQDNDIIFVDEVHTLVNGNKNRADWLLPWMLDGKLYTDRGAMETPKVTLLAATTDGGKLPGTMLSRFFCTPTIVPYTAAEAAEIASRLAGRMSIEVPEDAFGPLAQAADSNPRVMEKILTSVRNLRYVYPDSHPNLPKAFKFAGVSADGLTNTALDILMLLLGAPNYTMGLETLRASLGEPGPIGHEEQQLLRHGYVTVAGRGRKLTDQGIQRALQAARA